MKPSCLRTKVACQDWLMIFELVSVGRGASIGGEKGAETPGECLALSQARRVGMTLGLHRSTCLFWYPFIPVQLAEILPSFQQLLSLGQTSTVLSIPHYPSASPSLQTQTLPRQRFPPNLETRAPFPTENCPAITGLLGISDLTRQDGSVCFWVGGESSSQPLSRTYVANSQPQDSLQLALLTLPLRG